jgi:hypothetical protein
MVTDPPYGVEYDPEWRQIGWTGARATGRAEMIGEQIGARLGRYSPATWCMFGTPLCILHEVAESLTAVGMELRASIIWVNEHFQISGGHYQWQHANSRIACCYHSTFIAKTMPRKHNSERTA